MAEHNDTTVGLPEAMDTAVAQEFSEYSRAVDPLRVDVNVLSEDAFTLTFNGREVTEDEFWTFVDRVARGYRPPFGVGDPE